MKRIVLALGIVAVVVVALAGPDMAEAAGSQAVRQSAAAASRDREALMHPPLWIVRALGGASQNLRQRGTP